MHVLRVYVLRMHVLRIHGPLVIAPLVSRCPTKTFQASYFFYFSVCSLSFFNQFKTLLFKHYSSIFPSTYDAIFLELNVLTSPFFLKIYVSINSELV